MKSNLLFGVELFDFLLNSYFDLREQLLLVAESNVENFKGSEERGEIGKEQVGEKGRSSLFKDTVSDEL